MQWQFDQQPTSRGHKHVEDDQLRGSFSTELADAALCGMKPHLQRVERGTVLDLHYDFTVDDEFGCRKRTQGRHQFGKIATERFAGFCPEVDSLAALEADAAEAIPFRFVLPETVFSRQRLRRACLHRLRVQG